MELRKAFIGRAMRQSSVQALPMRVEPLKIEPKEWGDNALRGILQWRELEKIEMNFSTQRNGTLYRFEKISHMYQEA